MRFIYRSGQRPLDGYTIKRGVGKGGFGEVYFAVSDGGKEVALKFHSGQLDVELRGVASCLNLKHPNLVHVYDLKEDDHGNTWLVMEYVLGESLAQIVGRYPHGLPINLAKEWFVSLARAVGYLHDHGVIHRDLKPANIFVENGTLKVGDYGLCRSIHTSQRMSKGVGTVHYMAPEISTGNYNKSIDIYACGIILHEMLTGRIPFDGETDGEILMKHLTATPDLSRAPAAFQPVLAKALDKNPLRRYATILEMARAVEAAAPAETPFVPVAVPVVPPVAPPAAVPPAPDPIPAPQAAVPPPLAPPAPAAPLPVAAPVPARQLPVAVPVPGPTTRDRLTDLTGTMVAIPLVVVVSLVPYALVAQTTDWSVLGKLFVLTVLLGWAMTAGAGAARFHGSDSWGRRLRLAGLGALVGCAAFWLDGLAIPGPDSPQLPPEPYPMAVLHGVPAVASAAARYTLYFGLILGAGRWWRTVAKDRKDRFSLFPPIAAAFWGSVLLFLWPWEIGSPVAGGIVPLVLAAVAAQVAAPWVPAPVALPKKLRYRPA
ncbi:serine/threonine-protein kinase [Fimbriiglobus ruber]|uniref:Serine/threonine protein kinase PrkC, regulator of stationary phase n=1 Tax=Fimbriiglobus ruber TaxID=1908690 RepID=A0A225DTM7_9BACT|nr:serine/threonine-protein kinase [Fimbriiglobus ruber]OWK41898.1 Serine/threonine protein kinase PrkC, regulator of stationary phase [Fimbriiglobus ruber]